MVGMALKPRKNNVKSRDVRKDSCIGDKDKTAQQYLVKKNPGHLAVAGIKNVWFCFIG